MTSPPPQEHVPNPQDFDEKESPKTKQQQATHGEFASETDQRKPLTTSPNKEDWTDKCKKYKNGIVKWFEDQGSQLKNCYCCKSPDPNPNSERPSLQELRKLNIDPSAYHTLGNELLTADTMAEIDSSNPTTALDEILRNWQQGDQATWETLATALDKIGQNEKAADARLQYQCS